MSHESLPCLGQSIPSFEFFMKAWQALSDRVSRLRPFIHVGLEWANLYYNRMDNSPAHVIAMRTFYAIS
jgi:hypothetical protein